MRFGPTQAKHQSQTAAGLPNGQASAHGGANGGQQGAQSPWVEQYSQEHRRAFWYNTATQETSWNRPGGGILGAMGGAMAGVLNGPAPAPQPAPAPAVAHPKGSLEDCLAKSRQLVYLQRHPLQTNRLERLCATPPPGQSQATFVKEVAAHLEGVCPIADQSLRKLLSNFLEIKRQHGSPIEKHVYDTGGASVDEQVDGLVNRLLHKRPLVFCEGADR